LRRTPGGPEGSRALRARCGTIGCGRDREAGWVQDMSIYATLWQLQFPRYGDDHTACEWG